MAQRFGARVDVLHVFMLPASAIGPYGIPPSDEVVAKLRARAEELLEGASEPLEHAEVAFERHLHQGLPSEVVAREAERLGSDLIVMGTRGHTGLKHVFLGSVTERTVRIAPCSVLTTKDGDAI